MILFRNVSIQNNEHRSMLSIQNKQEAGVTAAATPASCSMDWYRSFKTTSLQRAA